MRELPRFPGKLRVAKALLGNLEGPGTEEALCPPSQVECHLVKTIRAGVRARAHTQICAQLRSSHIGWKSFWKTYCRQSLILSVISVLPTRACARGRTLGHFAWGPAPSARESYARARASKVEKWMDEIVPISDSVIGEEMNVVTATRNAVDVRKWVASRLMPN